MELSKEKTGYQTQSPILLILFNRPETTELVFNSIKEAKPPFFYIAGDGPRAGHSEDSSLCAKARKIAAQVDWPCEVKTLFREQNLGCKEAVSSAISWFFDQEEEGIILEDDCLPSSSFFMYCDSLLHRYRNDTRIRHIGGANLQHGKKWGNNSYYFSNLTHVWGWASWRRVWQAYDKDLSLYREEDVRNRLSNIFNDPFVLDSWEMIFKKLKENSIDTWDYQLTFINFFNNGLSVIPNKNLISNIGFSNNATHTSDSQNPCANIPLQELTELNHPLYVLPEKLADMATLSYDFDLQARYKSYNKWSSRFKRLIEKKKNA